MVLWLVSWFIYAVIIIVTCSFLPGIYIAGFGKAFIIALVLALLNLFLKPVLILLTLPLTFLTAGLFLIVINVIILYVAAGLIDGFVINSFAQATIASVVISVFSKMFF